MSTLWRHFGDIDSNTDQNKDIGSRDYIDLSLTWDVTDKSRLRLGINNLLDEEPPVLAGFAGNTHTGIYDSLGQYWFAGLTVNF